MNYWILKLLTQRGIIEIIYSFEKDLDSFIENCQEKYGSFIQLNSEEIVSRNEMESEMFEQLLNLDEGGNLDYKPFLITYSIEKDHCANVKVHDFSTGNGCYAECTMPEFFRVISAGNLSLLKWIDN